MEENAEQATTIIETATNAAMTIQAEPERVNELMELTTQSIYLMGASFVLGSLFTLFLLLVLDFVRRGKPGQE